MGREVLDLGKGHAERLMGVIEAALAQAGCAYADIGALAVSIGPGSFTGVRVGVATARGLALALDVPAIGITTLEALAAQARDDRPGRPTLARIEAGRGQAYVAAYAADGRPTLEPVALSIEDAGRLVAAAGPDAIIAEGQTADIAVYARLAAQKLAADPDIAATKPKPLYLRDADAKPQEAFALPRKEGA